MFVPLAFVFGLLSACGALVLELLLIEDSSDILATFTLSFTGILPVLSMVLIEELSKFIFLRQYIRSCSHLSKTTLRHPFPAGIGFGIGFASLEILLMLNTIHSVPWQSLLSITALHILTSNTLLVTLRLNARYSLLAFFGLFLAITMHAVYNFSILLPF
ncbi:MAG: hypothetical protein ACSLEX_01255 [Minisyncoccota bacterium]